MGVNAADLRPDWPAQVSRVVAPCVNNKSHQWHRTGPVITLGEMFLALGKKYTAKTIYAFYRTCRLVALKNKSSGQTEGGAKLCQRLWRVQHYRDDKQCAPGRDNPRTNAAQ